MIKNTESDTRWLWNHENSPTDRTLLLIVATLIMKTFAAFGRKSE